jgi:hypothetical protein
MISSNPIADAMGMTRVAAAMLTGRRTCIISSVA